MSGKNLLLKTVLTTALICLASLGAFAQHDTIYYNRQKPVNWKDFRGEPKMHDNYHVAEINSGISLNSEVSDSQNDILDFSVRPYMLPAKSWVKPGYKNREVLAHERLHFDITYLYSLKLKHALSAARITYQSYDKVNNIFDKVMNEMDARQNKYDRETDGGTIDEQQQKWEIMIHKAIREELSK